MVNWYEPLPRHSQVISPPIPWDANNCPAVVRKISRRIMDFFNGIKG
jgi:hypothetical protein